MLAAAVRAATGAVAKPGAAKPDADELTAKSGQFVLASTGDVNLRGDLAIPKTTGRHSAVLLLVA
jgi:hypothetical protein